MKRLVFALALVFLLGSCGELGFYDTKIKNDSSFDVTFDMNSYTIHAATHTVRANESITVSNSKGSRIDAFRTMPLNRVEYIQENNWEGTFIDLPSIPIKVYNTLSIPVTLSTNGFFETDPMLNIPPGKDTVAHENIIFTKSPVFIVSTDSFPVTADFQIVDGIMYVTIR